MIPVILSAGRGSRVGKETSELPKWFLQINNNTIYDYQLSSLEDHFDTVYVVLGHGFEHREPPYEILPNEYDINVEPLVFPEWETVDNAASAAYALNKIPDDDLLLICGDIITKDGLIDEIISKYQSEVGPLSYSAVAAIEGVQKEKTAVQWDSDEYIKKYGKIEGHEEAGIFILNKNHLNKAKNIWEKCGDEWFPIIFPLVDSKPLKIDGENQYEINTKSDLAETRKELGSY